MQSFILRHPQLVGWLWVAKWEISSVGGFALGMFLSAHLTLVWH